MSVTIDTSTTASATATPEAILVGVAPSDSSLEVMYHNGSGPHFATAQSPYTSWSTQAIGSATARNGSALVIESNDNADVALSSPSSGLYWFHFARSGNTWSNDNLAGVGTTGGADSAGDPSACWIGIDIQNRLWVVAIDNSVTPDTILLASSTNGGSSWATSTPNGTLLGERNPYGLAAALIGNYLVIVYDSGSGGLSYRRVDVHNATLGSWSSASTFGSISDVTTGSVLSLRPISGGSTGMLVYSGTNGISALLYDAGADSWGSATVLSSSTNDRHPVLISGASGTVYAVWCQYAATSSYALVASLYQSGAWQSSPTTLEASGNTIAWPNGAYLSSTSELALVWTQGTSSPYNVNFATMSLGPNSNILASTDTLALTDGWLFADVALPADSLLASDSFQGIDQASTSASAPASDSSLFTLAFSPFDIVPTSDAFASIDVSVMSAVDTLALSSSFQAAGISLPVETLQAGDTFLAVDQAIWQEVLAAGASFIWSQVAPPADTGVTIIWVTRDGQTIWKTRDGEAIWNTRG